MFLDTYALKIRIDEKFKKCLLGVEVFGLTLFIQSDWFDGESRHFISLTLSLALKLLFWNYIINYYYRMKILDGPTNYSIAIASNTWVKRF